MSKRKAEEEEPRMLTKPLPLLSKRDEWREKRGQCIRRERSVSSACSAGEVEVEKTKRSWRAVGESG
jgi:hypothetical protein